MKYKKSKWAFGILVLILLGATLVLNNCSSFGGSISGKRLERVEASSHYQDGQFVNTLPQSPYLLGETWDVFVEQLFGDQLRHPPSDIPVIPILPTSLSTPPSPGLRAMWIGHAGVLVEMDGFRFFVDPVFSEYASPFSFIGPKRFHPPPIALADLPKIDAVMISHDHYDHLDMETVKHLGAKGTLFFVPLGVGAHLEAWDIPDAQIIELEWGESKAIGEITIVSTPTRHYSGRGLFDYKETFWSSWSIMGPKHRVFYSGDTGFSDHFQKIGNQFGPFDLSIIKVGAYGPGDSWLDIHMDPEHAVEAHLAVQGRRLLPVHWATFNMAIHDWDEPIKRTLKIAQEKQVDLVTPRIGEVITIGQPFHSSNWWEQVH